MELGSQKPSQLLRRMKDLVRGKIPDSTLQIMWNGHLPAAVQAVLAVTEVKDLDNLAKIADKVMEASRPVEVAEVATHSMYGDSSSTKDLVAVIEKLSVEVAELRHSRQTQRSGNRGRSRSRDFSRNRKHPNWLCFYHYRYHNRATKCVEPCNWKKPRSPFRKTKCDAIRGA